MMPNRASATKGFCNVTSRGAIYWERIILRRQFLFMIRMNILAAAKTAAERKDCFANVLGAYRALFELKRNGQVRAVGIGSKDWRVIREISEQIPLDRAMFGASPTVYSHPAELLEFIAQLHARGVGMINSAVFNAGFLTGGAWFDYRKPDPATEAPLFAWREKFLAACKTFGVNPADVCVQFGLALPGAVSVALNTGKPERIKENVASATNEIPSQLWRALKEAGLIAKNYPIGFGLAMAARSVINIIDNGPTTLYLSPAHLVARAVLICR